MFEVMLSNISQSRYQFRVTTNATKRTKGLFVYSIDTGNMNNVIVFFECILVFEHNGKATTSLKFQDCHKKYDE